MVHKYKQPQRQCSPKMVGALKYNIDTEPAINEPLPLCLSLRAVEATQSNPTMAQNPNIPDIRLVLWNPECV